MKNIKKQIKVALTLLILSMPSLLFAQPGLDDQVIDVNVPFDDGVSILVALAIVYGLYRVWAYNRSEKLKKGLI